MTGYMYRVLNPVDNSGTVDVQHLTIYPNQKIWAGGIQFSWYYFKDGIIPGIWKITETITPNGGDANPEDNTISGTFFICCMMIFKIS
jgi:hypothetical protein